MVHFTGVPAPKYLKDDAWFGPAVLSDPQMTLKEAFDHAVSDGQLLPEDDTVEPKDIHEVIYNIATSSGKTTTQLNPTPQFGQLKVVLKIFRKVGNPELV